MAEMTYLVTIEQAAFDILYALMLADGIIEDSEIEVIKDFLRQESIQNSHLFNHEKPYFGDCNHSKELEYLKSLDKEGLNRRFKKAVKSVKTWLAEGQASGSFQKNLFEFGEKMIAADGKIVPEEKELIEYIASEWEMK